jgi:uncharacterized membrane protein
VLAADLVGECESRKPATTAAAHQAARQNKPGEAAVFATLTFVIARVYVFVLILVLAADLVGERESRKPATTAAAHQAARQNKPGEAAVFATLTFVIVRVYVFVLILVLAAYLVGERESRKPTTAAAAHQAARQNKPGEAAVFATLTFVFVRVYVFVLILVLAADLAGKRKGRKPATAAAARQAARQNKTREAALFAAPTFDVIHAVLHSLIVGHHLSFRSMEKAAVSPAG